MWTYLARFLIYNALGLKKLYNRNSHDWKLIPMHFINAFRKNFFSIQILVSKLLYCISFLLFTKIFLNHWKETFLISLTLLLVYDPNFKGLTIILQLITILLTLKNFRVTILTLSISYLHLRENQKTGIISRENFKPQIIYIINGYKFHKQFLKSGNKYQEKTEQRLVLYT